jgi:TetR/AcrR family transcriptional repressor of nem operon
MTVAPRTANGRATRERILRAATDLIADRGVSGTSLEDVRKRARASKSQLYLYFTDREALVREVTDQTCDQVVTRHAEKLSGVHSLAGIERYLDALVDRQAERETQTGCPIGTLAGQLARQDEDARRILARGLGRWEQELRAGLDAMAARGELRDEVDPAPLATQTLALIQGGLLLSLVRNDARQIRLAADAVLTLVRAALR